MALVGVLARACVTERERLEGDLARLPGVSTFRVGDEEERFGILIESASLEEAHALLTGTIDRLDGILGTWPVFAHTEPEAAPLSVGDGTVVVEDVP